jgi:hypothetical protein
MEKRGITFTIILIAIVKFSIGQVDHSLGGTPVPDQSYLFYSKQTGQYTHWSGSASITTDRFEHGWIKIDSVTGPILWHIDDSLEIDINQTKSWAGWIMPDTSLIVDTGWIKANLHAEYDVHYSKPHESEELVGYPMYVLYTKNEVTEGTDTCTGGCGFIPHNGIKGVHDSIHSTGSIDIDINIYSISIEIDEAKTSFVLNSSGNLIATLVSKPCPADVYNVAEKITWETPDGLYSGQNVTCPISSWMPDQNILIIVTYEIQGIKCYDTANIMLTYDKLIGFKLPNCIDTTISVAEIAQLEWQGSGNIKPEVYFDPDILKLPVLFQYYDTVVTAYSLTSTIKDTIYVVNSDNKLSIEPSFDLSKLNDAIENFKKTLAILLITSGPPCEETGSLLPTGTFKIEIYKQCCNNTVVRNATDLTVALSWVYGSECEWHFPFPSFPLLSFDLLFSHEVEGGVSHVWKMICTDTVTKKCLKIDVGFSVSGGIGFTLALGLASANVQLVIDAATVNAEFCYSPPPRTLIATGIVGALNIEGSINFAWGLTSLPISYSLWESFEIGPIKIP